MSGDFERILLSEQDIAGRVRELGAVISADYKGRDLLVVGVLKGSVVFLSDLIRAITIPVSLDFLAVSSYGEGTQSSGAVRILKDLDTQIEGRDVLIVEDILDSGMTLSYIIKLLSAARPASVGICTLLDKPDRRKAEITPDYLGFSVPDEFLVGYGLDYAEKYRSLPFIAVLARHVYEG